MANYQRLKRTASGVVQYDPSVILTVNRVA